MTSRVVLVVDEDEGARAEIRQCLADRQLACFEARTAEEALEKASAHPPDLMLIDLYLPDQSGLGLCRTVRESPQLCGTPIIVLTSRASEIDRILAFEAGVDDFLPKPFYPPELGARISAVLRGFASRPRNGAPAPARSRIQLDPASGRVWVEGRRVDLTPREFDLLRALVAQAGRVVRRSQLIERLWGPDAPHSERAIDAHVKSIRRKLGPARGTLQTVRGVGYRLSEEAVEETTDEEPGEPAGPPGHDSDGSFTRM